MLKAVIVWYLEALQIKLHVSGRGHLQQMQIARECSYILAKQQAVGWGAWLAERGVLAVPQTWVCWSSRQTDPKQGVGEGKSSQRRTLEACAPVRGRAGGEAAAAHVPSTPGAGWVPHSPPWLCTLPGQRSRPSAALPRANTVLSSAAKEREFPWCRGAPSAAPGVQVPH